MQHVFEVQGMTCGHCEKSVTQAVQRLDPQAAVQIGRTQNRVVVDSSVDKAVLAAAIQEEGYAVR